jgi:tripartite-type tricarboxylate transporter receptor subunit TctC
LGETVLVENRPGAGGNIALDYVAAAAPDGRMLVLITNSLVINPLVDQTAKFDPQKSFTPIALLAYSPVLLVAKNALPVQTLPELIRYAKTHKLSYASCGNGSIHQIAAETLKMMAGIDLLHVPYKGCGPAVTDVAGGQVDLSMNSLTSTAPFLEAKRVKAIAVTSAKPSALLPGVPTVASSGLAGYSFDGWYAMLAPAGTPQPVVDRINTAVNKALADPEIRKIMGTSYLEPVGGTPAALADTIASETTRYRQIVKTANIRAN